MRKRLEIDIDGEAVPPAWMCERLNAARVSSQSEATYQCALYVQEIREERAARKEAPKRGVAIVNYGDEEE